MKGEQAVSVIVSTTIFTLGLLSFKRGSMLLFNTFLIISIIEAVSYYTVGTPITKQIITSLDINYVTQENHNMIIYIIICFIGLIVASSVSFSRFSYVIPINRTFSLMNFIILLFFFLNEKIKALDGEMSDIKLSNGDHTIYSKLFSMITEKPRVLNHSKDLKNIILLNIESFEYQAITEKATPFLYELSKKYLFINATQSNYSHWTTSSTLLTQCGVPQLMFTIDPRVSGIKKISKFQKFNCLTDYLKILGYKAYYYGATNGNMHGFRDWKDSKYVTKYLTKRDDDLFNYTINDLISLNDNKTHGNFISWILNIDTHMPYEPPSWCKPENTRENSLRKQHNCYDQNLRLFVNKFMNSSLKENTVLIIYPDHLIMSKWGNRDLRRIFLLLPGFSKDIPHRDNLTYYDFVHTILDLAGVKSISPSFIYGRSAFSTKPSSFPNNRDLKEMYLAMVQLF